MKHAYEIEKRSGGVREAPFLINKKLEAQDYPRPTPAGRGSPHFADTHVADPAGKRIVRFEIGQGGKESRKSIVP
jgi:hypothetical protein